jgi:hypothetical protein
VTAKKSRAKREDDDEPEADDAAGFAAWIPLVKRFALGVLPGADGGPPPAVRAAKTSLVTALCAVLGLVLGSAVGLILWLVLWKVPEIPTLVVGLGVGAFVGAAAAVILASRFPLVRKGGGIALLLSPILILLAPFLLLWGAAVLLRRSPKR